MLNVIKPTFSFNQHNVKRINSERQNVTNISFSGLHKDVFVSTVPKITKLSKDKFREVYPLYLKYRESANIKSSVKEVKKFLNEENKRTGDEIFLAKSSDKSIGFLHFGREYSTLSGDYRYRIKAMFVDDEYRGKGVAKQLIGKMQEFAQGREIVVKARRSNEHSPFLYPKKGFKEDDFFIHFTYKND